MLQAVPSGRLVTFSSYDDYATVTEKLANVTAGPRPADAAAFWTGAMLTSGGRWVLTSGGRWVQCRLQAAHAAAAAAGVC